MLSETPCSVPLGACQSHGLVGSHVCADRRHFRFWAQLAFQRGGRNPPRQFSLARSPAAHHQGESSGGVHPRGSGTEPAARHRFRACQMDSDLCVAEPAGIARLTDWALAAVAKVGRRSVLVGTAEDSDAAEELWGSLLPRQAGLLLRLPAQPGYLGGV